MTRALALFAVVTMAALSAGYGILLLIVRTPDGDDSGPLVIGLLSIINAAMLVALVVMRTRPSKG